MRLLSVHIQGYRSLYDVTLKPGHITVLAGPNNSGKTNLVEALEFLGEAYRHGLEVAVNRKGGIENISHRRMRRTSRPLSFTVRAELVSQDLTGPHLFPSSEIPPLIVEHHFEFSGITRSIRTDFTVERETLDVSLIGPRQKLFSVRRDSEGTRIRTGRMLGTDLQLLIRPFEIPDFREFFERALEPTDLLTTFADYNIIIRSYVQQLGATRLYQLVPTECRSPGVPTPNADLETHGGNLPAMIGYLRKKDDSAWHELLALMQRVVPGLVDIQLANTPDRKMALRFAERGVQAAWSAEDISDGTIQSLALFASLLDDRSPLLLVEEPENSVHAWIIRNFIDACRKASNKQIIITTHSPVLISYVHPQDIVIVYRRDLRTQVARLVDLDPDAEKLWGAGQTGLFELLDSGFLPDAVPGEVL